MEPNTISIENTQQNPPQIPESSYSEVLAGQVQNPSIELQQQNSESLPSRQIQAEKNLYDYNINEETKMKIN